MHVMLLKINIPTLYQLCFRITSFHCVMTQRDDSQEVKINNKSELSFNKTAIIFNLRLTFHRPPVAHVGSTLA
jgi:hypothetical protein